MSLKHKFKNPEGIYFVTFSVVSWLDVFTRDIYREILIDSLNWSIKNKGLVVNAWVLMTNHVHMIIRRKGKNKLEDILRDTKKFTSVKIIEKIKLNPEESRTEWMLQIFEQKGRANSQNEHYQFWQHGNHPIELDNNSIMEQKLDYLHNNPVEAGYVTEPHHWKYSSAGDYAGIKGYINIEKLL
jgi:REP element-mobilizing transposase RayT